MFWQRQLDSITQCDFRSWGNSLFNEILETCDENGAAQLEFSNLINDFELLETLGDEISRNAFVLDSIWKGQHLRRGDASLQNHPVPLQLIRRNANPTAEYQRCSFVVGGKTEWVFDLPGLVMSTIRCPDM